MPKTVLLTGTSSGIGEAARLEAKSAELERLKTYVRAKIAWQEAGERGDEPMLAGFTRFVAAAGLMCRATDALAARPPIVSASVRTHQSSTPAIGRRAAFACSTAESDRDTDRPRAWCRGSGFGSAPDHR
jgi:hypothetical protein